MSVNLIIGGSGFIGQHLIQALATHYINLDIIKTENNYQYSNVKNPIDIKLDEKIDIIYNLAAIHTTPGHKYH